MRSISIISALIALSGGVVLALFMAETGRAEDRVKTMKQPCFNNNAETDLENYVPGQRPLRFLKKRVLERAASVEDAEARLNERKRRLWKTYCDANETGWVDDKTFDQCELDWAGSLNEDKDGSILIRVYAINCKLVRKIASLF